MVETEKGSGRTEMALFIVALLLAVLGIAWLFADAFRNSLQQEGGFPVAEWVVLGIGLLVGFPLNDYVRGKLQARGLGHTANLLGILSAVAAFLLLYGMYSFAVYTLSG